MTIQTFEIWFESLLRTEADNFFPFEGGRLSSRCIEFCRSKHDVEAERRLYIIMSERMKEDLCMMH